MRRLRKTRRQLPKKILLERSWQVNIEAITAKQKRCTDKNGGKADRERSLRLSKFQSRTKRAHQQPAAARATTAPIQRLCTLRCETLSLLLKAIHSSEDYATLFGKRKRIHDARERTFGPWPELARGCTRDISWAPSRQRATAKYENRKSDDS